MQTQRGSVHRERARRSAIDFVKAEHVRRRHSCRCEWLIGWLPASGLQVAGRWEPRPSRSTGLLVQYGLRSTPTKPLGAKLVTFTCQDSHLQPLTDQLHSAIGRIFFSIVQGCEFFCE